MNKPYILLFCTLLLASSCGGNFEPHSEGDLSGDGAGGPGSSGNGGPSGGETSDNGAGGPGSSGNGGPSGSRNTGPSNGGNGGSDDRENPGNSTHNDPNAGGNAAPGNGSGKDPGAGGPKADSKPKEEAEEDSELEEEEDKGNSKPASTHGKAVTEKLNSLTSFMQKGALKDTLIIINAKISDTIQGLSSMEKCVEALKQGKALDINSLKTILKHIKGLADATKPEDPGSVDFVENDRLYRLRNGLQKKFKALINAIEAENT